MPRNLKTKTKSSQSSSRSFPSSFFKNLQMLFFLLLHVFTSPKQNKTKQTKERRNERRRNAWCGHWFMSKNPRNIIDGKKGGKKDQQHAIKIHYEEKINKKVQNRNYYRTCPACRINILMHYICIFFSLTRQAINRWDVA